MTLGRFRIVLLGLSITSSWGNGHASTYRALVRALAARGHDVLFLERDVPWYAAHRDLPLPPFARTALYGSLDELDARYRDEMRQADCVVVGSYVPDGTAVGDWVLAHAAGVRAFYDIDTPITLAALDRGDATYVAPRQVRDYDLYLSFTGGPLLDRLETSHGARRARAFYCSFDPSEYYPAPGRPSWDLGYLGTYSDDRQPALDALLLQPARRLPRARFEVAGAAYPEGIDWPANVAHVEHVPPREHRAFYSAQRFTLNVTRAAMVQSGHSPSVRLFEAAACAVPVISDRWPGLETFFTPGQEIFVADGAEDVLRLLRDVSDAERRAVGMRARQRVLRAHTPMHRVLELERLIAEVRGRGREMRAS
jgi:spore maturation protein CgeB